MKQRTDTLPTQIDSPAMGGLTSARMLTIHTNGRHAARRATLLLARPQKERRGV